MPLNDSALDVLRQLDTEGTFEHLFINRQTGKPYTTIMKVWSRLRAEAGVPHPAHPRPAAQYASFLVNSGRTSVRGAADPGALGPVGDAAVRAPVDQVTAGGGQQRIARNQGVW